MPRSRPVDPSFGALLAEQDFVVTRKQAYAAGLTRHALANRQEYDGWHRLVGDVFQCHPGEPSRRQLLIAALLFAGEARRSMTWTPAGFSA